MKCLNIYFVHMDMDTVTFRVYPSVKDGISLMRLDDQCMTVRVSIETAGAVNSMPQTEIIERCLIHLKQSLGLTVEDKSF
jgi:hypothetical protein